MSVTVNGVELSGMTYNGVEVNSWVHNGAEVYSAVSGMPPFIESEWTISGVQTQWGISLTVTENEVRAKCDVGGWSYGGFWLKCTRQFDKAKASKVRFRLKKTNSSVSSSGVNLIIFNSNGVQKATKGISPTTSLADYYIDVPTLDTDTFAICLKTFGGGELSYDFTITEIEIIK